MGAWKIQVRDFQSIKRGEVIVEPGLNILSGPTNRGKTALFRAVDSAMFNSGTDDLVRAGATTAGVTITNGEHGMVYLRNAGSKSEKTAYQIDGGTVQKKVGRTQLPEVADAFGVRDVRMQNGVRMKLNFWYQNDRPFLMDKTAGQLYEFLSLSSSDRYVKVLKQMQADIKVTEAEINNANATIDTLKAINNKKRELLDRNEGFDKVYERAVVADRKSKELARAAALIGSIEQLSQKISEAQGKLRQLESRMKSAPNMGLLKTQCQRASELESLSTSCRKRLSALNDTMSRLKHTGERLDLVSGKEGALSTALEGLAPRVSEAEKLQEQCLKASRLQSSISDQFNKVELLAKRISRVREALCSIENLDAISLSITRASDGESRNSRCTEALSKTSALQNKVFEARKRALRAEGARAGAEEAFESFKESIGACPFCGSPLSEGHNHKGEGQE